MVKKDHALIDDDVLGIYIVYVLCVRNLIPTGKKTECYVDMHSAL